jgi:hypothetical protein
MVARCELYDARARSGRPSMGTHDASGVAYYEERQANKAQACRPLSEQTRRYPAENGRREAREEDNRDSREHHPLRARKPGKQRRAWLASTGLPSPGRLLSFIGQEPIHSIEYLANLVLVSVAHIASPKLIVRAHRDSVNVKCDYPREVGSSHCTERYFVPTCVCLSF